MTYLLGKHPFIKLKVKLSQNTWHEVECLIDTGFSGGLALPLDFKKYFPKKEFVDSRFILANGTEVTVETTYTTVEFETSRKEVAVIFMGESDSLVGVEFSDQMRFCLDLYRQRVELITQHSSK